MFRFIPEIRNFAAMQKKKPKQKTRLLGNVDT